MIGLTSLEQLSLAQTISITQLGASYQTFDKINNLLSAVLSIKTLKALDMSKNKLHPENVMSMLRHACNAEKLDVLILSSLDSLNDETASQLIDFIKAKPDLKKLSISGCTKLCSSTVSNIVAALIQCRKIKEVDFSKCHFDGNFSSIGALLT
jgi:hypothetical protein